MFLSRLEKRITDFIQSSPHNFVGELGGMQIYTQPLIGVADASDPMWEQLKKVEVVGPDHLTPTEWLPEAKSVISYYLPFTKQIRSSNHKKGFPSIEWLYGRYEGEIFNNTLRKMIIAEIELNGEKAVAPALDERFSINNHISNWSERHAAFIAGLGTFSWSHTLITHLGTAGRIGSVITNEKLEFTPRTYNEIDQYCNKCGDCIKRCPPRAINEPKTINENNMDKERCSKFLDRILERNHPRYGCGKCQTAVCCEDQKALENGE